MAKKSAPPCGAELLYSRLIVCEWRDGLVRIEVASGEYVQGGVLPLRVAMELHHKLGRVIDAALDSRVVAIDATKSGH